MVLIIIIIVVEKYRKCKAMRDRLINTLSVRRLQPHNKLTNRMKKEKEKTVDDKKGASSYSNEKALPLLLKPANSTPSNTTGSPRSFHRY